MSRTVRQGLLAGLLAGFLTGLLFVVDYGPANSLHGVARWFALDSPGSGKLVGLLLMLLLGGLFGLLFGVIATQRQPAQGRWLLLGLAMGATWWVLVALVLGTLINHVRMDFATFLFYSVPLLVYGLLLGSISFQWRQQNV